MGSFMSIVKRWEHSNSEESCLRSNNWEWWDQGKHPNLPSRLSGLLKQQVAISRSGFNYLTTLSMQTKILKQYRTPQRDLGKIFPVLLHTHSTVSIEAVKVEEKNTASSKCFHKATWNSGVALLFQCDT